MDAQPASVAEPATVAAPATAAPLLVGAPRAIQVAAVTPAAGYLSTGDPAFPALCLGTRDAVRLPCTLVLRLDRVDRPFAGWRVGQPGTVGDGRVRVGDRSWRVARWWRPDRIRALGPPADPRSAAMLARHVPDPLDAAARASVGRLISALRAGTDPRPAVRNLLGRGPGLTPLGDDLLAATLLTLGAFDGAAAGPLAAALAVDAPMRTTVVSAALLAHAARGECVAALAGLLAAVGRGAAEPELARAAAAVTAIGHTSGSGLVHGVLAGLAVTAPRTVAGTAAPRTVAGTAASSTVAA